MTESSISAEICCNSFRIRMLARPTWPGQKATACACEFGIWLYLANPQFEKLRIVIGLVSIVKLVGYCTAVSYCDVVTKSPCHDCRLALPDAAGPSDCVLCKSSDNLVLIHAGPCNSRKLNQLSRRVFYLMSLLQSLKTLARPHSKNDRSFWLADDRVKACYECDVPFNLLTRRHHCRSCGRIFCSSCTTNSVLEEGASPERVCNFCKSQRHLEWLASTLPVVSFCRWLQAIDCM